MFIRRFLRYSKVIVKSINEFNWSKPPQQFVRPLTTSSSRFDKERYDVAIRDPFADIKDKNKNTYLEMIKIYINRENVYRRGHVDFIYAALARMEEFGVNKDIETYKSLIDVLPKGKFIPENLIQAEFMHYPKQQQCIIDLLEQMEENGVMPDYDMEDQLLAIFGKWGYPLRRYWRMMYWMPKFRNLSPFPLPDPLPSDTFELAKLAIERISNVDVTNKVTVYSTKDIKDSIDDTWIVSAQSETQKKLLKENKKEDPIFVEGAFTVWLKGNPINYFILRGQARPYKDEVIDRDDVTKIEASFFTFKPPQQKTYLTVEPTTHEQEDGVIYALCATGMSSKDSLLSWIRHLEKDGNEKIADLSVVFTLRSAPNEIANIQEEEEDNSENSERKKEIDGR